MSTQKSVLIVDDVAFARKVLKDMISTSRNYNVIGEAANGYEAIIKTKQLKPEIIILDVVMPKMGGTEAARKILEDNKEVKIVMMSSLMHEHLLMEAVNAGARDFIAKPFSTEDIISSLDKVTEGDTGESQAGGAAKGKAS